MFDPVKRKPIAPPAAGGTPNRDAVMGQLGADPTGFMTNRVGGSLGADPSGSMNNRTGGALGAPTTGAMNNQTGGATGAPAGGWTTSPVAGPVPVTAPPTAPAPPPRENFSWGVHGKGVEGVDFGNTNSWDDSKWNQYYKDHNITPPAAAAPTPPPAATTSPVSPTEVYADPPPAADPGAPATSPTEDLRGQFHDALLQQLSANSKDVSIADPALKGQSDAFRVAQERSREGARADLAERLSSSGLGAVTGGSSGALEQGLVGLRQQQGEATAGFDAGLVGNELQNRRAQLQQTLALAGNQLNAEDQRALQQQIAEMGMEIQKQQMAQQSTQFGQSLDQQKAALDLQKMLGIKNIDQQAAQSQGQLGLQDKLGSGGLQLGLLQALMQNQQHGQGLGAQMGMFNAGLNQNALLQMLGGL